MTYADGFAYQKLSPVLRFILLSGAAWVLSTSVVLGTEVSSQTTHLDSEKRENIDTHLFAQASTNTNSIKIITITNIKVNSTDKGLELILETSQGRQLQVTNNSDGNNFIADINNAQLGLNNGGRFTQEKPVAGIAQITVTNKDANTIRITVIGEKGIPKAELFDSNQGLIFGFIPVTPSTEPSTTSPQATQPEQPSQEQPPAATEKKPEETPQSSEQNEEDVIELIVTAQKRAENLQDVPISITVLDRDQLESGDVQSFEEVAKNTPNFSVFGSGTNRLSSFYSVRGITNFNAFSRDGVGIYVDDVPYDFSGFQNLGFNDL
ncbi:MAG: AMIN domain-containing protein, partial [Cyanobacteria bacterium P01_D01_bin.50]